MNKEELRKASNEQLFDELDYCGCDSYYWDYRKEILSEIRARIERPKGKWITDSNYPDTVICNKCNSKYDVWWIDKGSNYCPNCGAAMEVKE